MSNPFSSVEVTKVPRSFFNLRKRVIGSYNYGKLYPVDIQDCLPGDTIKTFLASKIESLPMSAPNKTPVDVEFFQFFTPYRLLDENFEKYLAGNEDGTDFDYIPPKWDTDVGGIQSLWDYFGFGLAVQRSSSKLYTQRAQSFKTIDGNSNVATNDCCPIRYPRDAYNKIWNLYFRDETFMDEVEEETSNTLLYTCWKKDYFTSVLKAQCKPDIPPALALSGVGNVDFFLNGSTTEVNMAQGGSGIHLQRPSTGHLVMSMYPSADAEAHNADISGQVDFADAGTFGVDEMRLVFQIQKWLEKNARSGNRYNEFLLAHFGQSNGDARLQRPEFLGKITVPIFTSEVLQTSETATSPLGTRAGNQNGVGQNTFNRVHCSEFGVLMTLMCIRPRAEYSQGINRQWLKTSRYDWYFPEFAHLSERTVYTAELFLSIDGADPTYVANLKPFGFQEVQSEYRSLLDNYVGLLRTELDNWHIPRFFLAEPVMGKAFLQCIPSHNPYVNTSPNADCFVIETVLNYKAFRPIPKHGTPGLIDHF